MFTVVKKQMMILIFRLIILQYYIAGAGLGGTVLVLLVQIVYSVICLAAQNVEGDFQNLG